MARTTEADLTLRIVVTNPPRDVRFQVQRGAKELEPPVNATASALVFEIPVRVGKRPDGKPNFLGPFTQGPPAARFIYVNSGTLAAQSDSCWSRRAKIPLGAITWTLIDRAKRESAPVEIEVGGTGRDGGPSCGTIRFPESAWRLGRTQ